MTSGLTDLYNLLHDFPQFGIYLLCIFLLYKVVLYLSTTGAIVYLGREFLRLLNKYLETKINRDIKINKDIIKKPNLFYHGLVKIGDKKDWYYNRASLEELSKDNGCVESFYVTVDRVPFYV